MSQSAAEGQSFSPIEQAAIRKLMHVLDPKELEDNETMVDRAKRIGAEWERKNDQLNRLANQVVDLTEQVEELQAAVQNDDYEELTRQQKRLRVKKLVQKAAKENSGKGSVDYAEIRAVFNKKIPAGSAHYLMEQIAEEKGYRLDKRDGMNNLLKVDLSETDQEFFSSE